MTGIDPANPASIGVPLPTECMWCKEPLSDAERNMGIVSMHHECAVRSIVGSVGHLQKKCGCYGGELDDPPGMTVREAALAAYLEHNRIMKIACA